MNEEKINTLPRKVNVLVAPLDWGLGHATRCIPLINELLVNKCSVYIAASGASAALLKKEFPQLPIILIKGYNIHYTRNKFWLPFHLLTQLPKLCFRVVQENNWLKKWLKKNSIHLVISDNRLGFFHRTIPCIYITHQLKIKAHNTLTESIAQKIHYYFINKYNYCWVPDTMHNNSLAGELSHPQKMPRTPVSYIGPLSRLEKKELNIKYDLLFLISGPEPQRTIFENMIFSQLESYKGTALILRGLPGSIENKTVANPGVTILNHLPAAALGDAIQQSRMVIARSGYTTIMDLVKVNKMAILVPTPGQTEQEYLAKYLMDKKYFFSAQQEEFKLGQIIEKAEIGFFLLPQLPEAGYGTFIKQAVDNLIP